MSRPTDSVTTPLMERTVCEACGHMHRRALVGKCECCGRDVAQADRTGSYA